ncbi:Flavonoid 3'-monooxygenase [Dichanthelium oligosanthes]|uniref:Flavonoid 3'-monooxygenase n=1 Tax=Dichanthelium oligosanthes TaxID=888268 RepID=A0A1E5W4H5_9POAL|nr:Flavonoid 3'-monooxygenase [Dichanthelium oligosanthes]
MVLAAGILRKLSATLRRRNYKLPPGPRPWPVIGNFNLIGALPHRSVDELSKKYGPLMHLRFGSFSVVVASSVEMAKFFLKTNDVLFLDRPRTAAGKHTTYNYADMTWSPYGAYWRQARRICATELFSPRRLESFEYIRTDEVHTLVRGLFAASSSGRAVNLYKDHLSTLSMNVITRMVLGKRFFGEGADAVEGPVSSLAELKWMLDELMLLNGVLNIGDWIPWLDWLDLQGYVRRMKKLGKMFDAFMEHILDAHSERRRRDGEGFVVSNMVDVLMQLADDPTLEIKLTRVSVKAFTQDLIAGATESSSSNVEWAMSELLKKPSIIATATEELDRVVGRGRWVTEQDIPQLPYLQAIVKESLRMHPVAPLLTPRVAREDAAVGGYDIPKGTCVFVNAWAMSREPALWDAPEEFSPERFLGSKIDVKGHSYELMPFGSGRRMCPGYSLGLKVVQMGLANLLHGFTWGLPEGMAREELSMDEVFGLSITRKFPLQVVVEPRLPAELYA